MSEEWAALCDVKECGWSRTMNSEEEAKTVTVLHCIQKHPLIYAETTGKDPEHSAFLYQDLFRQYRKDL